MIMRLQLNLPLWQKSTPISASFDFVNSVFWTKIAPYISSWPRGSSINLTVGQTVIGGTSLPPPWAIPGANAVMELSCMSFHLQQCRAAKSRISTDDYPSWLPVKNQLPALHRASTLYHPHLARRVHVYSPN